MYKNKIKKAARKVKRDLKGKINVISLIEYLKRYGYVTVFFNTPPGDEILKGYGFDVMNKQGFTCYREETKLVFIDAKLSMPERVYVLLHELGHVIFKHIEIDGSEHLDVILREAEAEAFMYEVVTHNNILCIS